MKELGIGFGDARVFNLVVYTNRGSTVWSSKAVKYKEIVHVRVLEEVWNEETSNYEIDMV